MICRKVHYITLMMLQICLSCLAPQNAAGSSLLTNNTVLCSAWWKLHEPRWISDLQVILSIPPLSAHVFYSLSVILLAAELLIGMLLQE